MHSTTRSNPRVHAACRIGEAGHTFEITRTGGSLVNVSLWKGRTLVRRVQAGRLGRWRMADIRIRAAHGYLERNSSLWCALELLANVAEGGAA